MKFVVSSSALLGLLQTTNKVISSKNTLPILDYFLFDLKDGVLKITASDLETTLVGTLPVESVERRVDRCTGEVDARFFEGVFGATFDHRGQRDNMGDCRKLEKAVS